MRNRSRRTHGGSRAGIETLSDKKSIWERARHPVIAGMIVAILGAGAGWLWDKHGTKLYHALLHDPHPQKVRWISTEEIGRSGIEILHEVSGGESIDDFIRWVDLNNELLVQLLPQLFKDPTGYKFELRDFNHKKNWIIEIKDSEGKAVANLWLGHDPAARWAFDGLIRIGGDTPEHVWQLYQRYSNGTYRRLPSRISALEYACSLGSRPCVHNDK